MISNVPKRHERRQTSMPRMDGIWKGIWKQHFPYISNDALTLQEAYHETDLLAFWVKWSRLSRDREETNNWYFYSSQSTKKINEYIYWRQITNWYREAGLFWVARYLKNIYRYTKYNKTKNQEEVREFYTSLCKYRAALCRFIVKTKPLTKRTKI